MGVERFNHLQLAYLRICEAQSNPVAPDLQVMSNLQEQRMRIDVVTMTKETMQVQIQLLDTDECRDKLLALEVVGDIPTTSSKTLATPIRPHTAPAIRRGSSSSIMTTGFGVIGDANQSPFNRVMLAVAKLVSQSRILQDLTICTKYISTSNLKPLAQALEKNEKLVCLSLSGCAMGDAGLREIGGALASSSINLLDLSGNEITDNSGRCAIDPFHLAGT